MEGSGRTQQAEPEGCDSGRAGDSARLGWVLSVGVHREAVACGSWGAFQLHVHHVHVSEAAASGEGQLVHLACTQLGHLPPLLT